MLTPSTPLNYDFKWKFQNILCISYFHIWLFPSVAYFLGGAWSFVQLMFHITDRRRVLLLSRPEARFVLPMLPGESVCWECVCARLSTRGMWRFDWVYDLPDSSCLGEGRKYSISMAFNFFLAVIHSLCGTATAEMFFFSSWCHGFAPTNTTTDFEYRDVCVFPSEVCTVLSIGFITLDSPPVQFERTESANMAINLSTFLVAMCSLRELASASYPWRYYLSVFFSMRHGDKCMRQRIVD